MSHRFVSDVFLGVDIMYSSYPDQLYMSREFFSKQPFVENLLLPCSFTSNVLILVLLYDDISLGNSGDGVSNTSAERIFRPVWYMLKVVHL